MKLTYKLSALCGQAYKSGNIEFGPDDTSVLSIVGNRISRFQCSASSPSLTTLPWESRQSLAAMHISRDGNFIFAVEKNGRALLASYPLGVVLSRINLKHPINIVRFSPDSKFIAIAYPKFVQIWSLSSSSESGLGFSQSPLRLVVRIRCHSDEITSLTWSSCSQYLLTASTDMTCKLLLVTKKGSKSKYHPYTLVGHKDPIIGAYFSADESKEGAIFHWEWAPKTANSEPLSQPSNADEQESQAMMSEEEPEINSDQLSDSENIFSSELRFPSLLESTHYWTIVKRQYLNLKMRVLVTCAAFNCHSGLLAVGLSNGIFSLLDFKNLQEDNLAPIVQSMSIFQSTISAISLSARGEWIGLASCEGGQLTVWEWASESFQLRQKGIAPKSSALAITPDGTVIASAGATKESGGGIVLWDALTNFSFVTLGGKNNDENEDIEIKSPSSIVTAVAFCKKGKVVIAGSQDGTIRAFDLLRYRNFRTLLMPPASRGPISLLVADPAGEFVMASTDTPIDSSVGAPFGIFVWSLSTGHLVDILGGHQNTLTALATDPLWGRWIVSGSMDKTVRLWDIFNTSNASSANSTAVATFSSEVLALAVRPDSTEVAISLLSGSIVFCDTENLTQICMIDPSSVPRDASLSCILRSVPIFRTLAYSPDSARLFVGSENTAEVCIFGMEASHRPFLKTIKLSPSIKFHENSSALPVIKNLVVSGDSIVILSEGEGIYTFTLDESLLFDPFELSAQITPETTLQALDDSISKKDANMAATALTMALKLNDPPLIYHLFISMGIGFCENISSIITSLSSSWVLRLLCVFAGFIETSNQNIQLIMTWLHPLLSYHSMIIRKCVNNRRAFPGLANYTGGNVTSALRRIEAVLLKNYFPILKKSLQIQDEIAILPDLSTLSLTNKC